MKNLCSRSRLAFCLPLLALFALALVQIIRGDSLWLALIACLSGLALSLLAEKLRLAPPDPRMHTLQSVIAEVAAGRVSARIVNIGPKDELGRLCWHLNTMLDQLEACFREQQSVFQKVSTGHYFRKARPEGLHGVFREALEGSNASLAVIESKARTETLHKTQSEQAQTAFAAIISRAAAGDFSVRMDADKQVGVFHELAESLNTLNASTEAALKELAGVLHGLASGDLGQRMTKDYAGLLARLKGDTNGSLEQLTRVIGNIHEAANIICLAAQEIAAGNADLSARTEQQAASLEQTTSSMEELNNTVAQNAANAQRAARLAGDTNTSLLEAGNAVSKVIDAMAQIETSSHRVAEILGVIDSIAFQTNILALNAAVEAARAGEQGRGFAVVAGEVRMLAQRSAAAARDIKQLMDQSVSTVKDGSRRVGESQNSMGKVVAGMREVVELLDGISSASREQSLGIAQVAQAVASMDEVTQQNAALVEQAAAAAESLEEQATQLVQSVSRFKLDTVHI